MTFCDKKYYNKLSKSFSKFLEHYLKYGYQHQLCGSPKGMSAPSYGRFKELTSLIDYECDFKDGLCKVQRKYDVAVGDSNPKCCCAGCGNNIGYLDYIPSYEDAEQLWKIYSPVDGFWTDKGCRLPRNIRSVTCLIHSCEMNYSEPVIWLFDILRNGIHSIDEYYLQHIGFYERGDCGSHIKSEDVYKHLKSRLQYERNIRITNQAHMDEFEQMKFSW